MMTRCPVCALMAVLVCLAMTPAASAFAQTASFDDLRALRFYLTQNDAAAAQAELRRLRTTFPDWRPPADLNELLAPQAGGVSVDEAEIWRRIERNDFSGARGLIDAGPPTGCGLDPACGYAARSGSERSASRL
jgi:cellulose synthase operon protein C